MLVSRGLCQGQLYVSLHTNQVAYQTGAYGFFL